MDVQLDADQEMKIREIAARLGRAVDDLVREVVAVFIAEDEASGRAVEAARASIRRGHYIKNDKVREWLEQRERG